MVVQQRHDHVIPIRNHRDIEISAGSDPGTPKDVAYQLQQMVESH